MNSPLVRNLLTPLPNIGEPTQGLFLLKNRNNNLVSAYRGIGPDLLSRTAKSAPELTILEAELTFLEPETQSESDRTYNVGPPANTSGHGIYMCSVV